MTLLHQAAQKAVEAQERRAFEEWFEGRALECGLEHSNWFRRDSDGDYEINHVQSSWRAWQARSALQQQEVPREPVAPPNSLRTWDEFALRVGNLEYIAKRTTRQQEVGSGPYRTSAGDTLLGIAQRELGDGERWPEIKRLNMNAFDPESDGWSRPRAGTLLTLPAAPSTPENADGGPHG